MTITTQRVESELGTWLHAEWRPPRDGPLAGLLDRIWYFDGRLTHARERVFPDGTLELIVQLDQPHRPGDVPNASPFPAICMGGIRLNSEVVEAPPGRCRVLGVRLTPPGAFAAFGTALHEFTAITVDLRDLVGTAADELGELCSRAGSAEGCVRVAARWVSERVVRASGADRGIVAALRAIDRTNGMLRIAELADACGFARHRFTATFRDQVGTTPKRYARIARFRHAQRLLLAGTAPLGEIALAAGYYDQPHLTAEFREHAGLTPSAYLRAMRYPESASLAEASA
ncbi:MAG TPA: helix-turn-helix transcriptional regulator [Candidatus Acidoferrum sp.]|nr:helix-turn-helix transcriptional regulator [Candidatus Acidoferrum sp.]